MRILLCVPLIVNEMVQRYEVLPEYYKWLPDNCALNSFHLHRQLQIQVSLCHKIYGKT